MCVTNPNDLYWIHQKRNILKDKYQEFLNKAGLENTFDNCNDYLSLTYGLSVSKSEFGVSTRVALAKIISGKEPNDFSF